MPRSDLNGSVISGKNVEQIDPIALGVKGDLSSVLTQSSEKYILKDFIVIEIIKFERYCQEKVTSSAVSSPIIGPSSTSASLFRNTLPHDFSHMTSF